MDKNSCAELLWSVRSTIYLATPWESFFAIHSTLQFCTQPEGTLTLQFRTQHALPPFALHEQSKTQNSPVSRFWLAVSDWQTRTLPKYWWCMVTPKFDYIRLLHTRGQNNERHGLDVTFCFNYVLSHTTGALFYSPHELCNYSLYHIIIFHFYHIPAILIWLFGKWFPYRCYIIQHPFK